MKSDVKHLEKVDHSYIRYANVWEDADLLLSHLDINAGQKVLSIASAGDNALACLAHNPELVVAVDLNKTQLYLTELKKVAIQTLDRPAFLRFIGFKDDATRNQTYKNIKTLLSDESRVYWDQKSEIIQNGIIYSGKFEKYLGLFARKILPFIHSRKKVSQLLTPKSEEAQKQFYNQKWDSIRWKLFFRIFFSKKVMGWLGRDPAFLKHVNVNVGKTIYQSAAQHLSSVYAPSNPILHYCLNGNFGDHLPFYLQSENYERIKANISRLKLENGYAQDIFRKYGQFDRFNLSNIFEYMSDEEFQNTTDSIVAGGNKGAKLAYWNLLVKRVMADVHPKLTAVELPKNVKVKDKGFFYRKFHVDQI